MSQTTVVERSIQPSGRGRQTSIENVGLVGFSVLRELLHMMGLSPLELFICALVIVLLFGTRRLPELGSGLGKAISNFRKSYRDSAIDVTPPKDEKSEGPKV